MFKNTLQEPQIFLRVFHLLAVEADDGLQGFDRLCVRSAAEIAQRVAEWEEEMQSSGDDVQVMNMDIRERETAAHDVREETSGALTRIRVLTCLHLCGVDGETGESVELADVGRVILIMSSDAKTHVDGGMAVYA